MASQIDRSHNEVYWRTSRPQHSACLKGPPDGARAEPYTSSAVLRATGGDISAPRGEDRTCPDTHQAPTITCASVEVFTPPGEELLAWYREAREAGSATWVADPYPNLGWIDWIDSGASVEHDGRTRIWAHAKNWSENRDREIRVRAYVRA